MQRCVHADITLNNGYIFLQQKHAFCFNIIDIVMHIVDLKNVHRNDK